MTDATRRSPHWLDVLAVASILVALGFVLGGPSIASQGDAAPMLFVHVPTIWLAYLAFGVTFVASIAYLATKRLRWDLVAGSSAEIGVVFTTVAVIGGAIWGKATWNTYWTWDARLTLTAIMLFVYIGYLALRRAIVDPEARARRSSVLGILGLVQLIPVHFSVTWWVTLHQSTTFRPGDIQMDGPILTVLLVAVAAFTVIYAALLRHRVHLAELELAAYRAAAAVEGPVAGDAVTAPTIGTTEAGV
ncbi:MAG: cytochrome c biogenesis protein CcsA [Acidimicrobiia bacterium]|nr:cytochrome c biogenesis protein CcsA [Acidimicrobiia bacterium]MDX2467250.1 cytochrome c biogenesis protein CcsA [Acidimicrobiia bacterium]